MGKQWKQWQAFFSWAAKSLQMVTEGMKLKDAAWKKSYDQPRQHIKKQRHYFATKGPSSQSYDFISSHVWMWDLDHKITEEWKMDAFELWCWRRLLRLSWTVGRSNQYILKEFSPECSLEGLMLKLSSNTWPPDAKSWLIWKDPDAGNDWRWEEKGTAEDEMVGWHHRLNGHGFGRHDWATELNWLGFVLANEIQAEGLFASFKVLLVIQLCLILWDPMDCSLPDSSVHGIIQARILKW